MSGATPLPDATPYLAWLLGGDAVPASQPGDELLQLHGLLPLQQSRLTGSPPLETHLDSMRMEAVARRLAADLSEAGIEFLPLKGWDVAFRLYDDPGLRPMSDLDLWVGGEGAFEQALSLLLQLGYTQVNRGDYDVTMLDPAGQTLVELHHDLDSRHRARIDWNAVWSRRQTWDWQGLPLSRMDPSDLWCYLAFHFGKHMGLQRRLIWLLDLHLLQRQTPVDPHTVAEQAHRWRIRNALSATLWELKRFQLAHPDLDLPLLPAPFRSAPWDVGLFGRVRQTLYHLWIADRTWDRLRYGWEHRP